ncbi:MAG: ABC transporter ATP-binding protein [Promethearchaeota archaeon]
MKNWVINLENVTISYKLEARVAKKVGSSRIFTPLSNLNLSLFQGEFLSISGPNGSGKTSLLKVISGLMRPFSGKVTWRVSNFGYVSQSQVLLPELTLKENILLPFYLSNEGRDTYAPVMNMEREEIEKKLNAHVKRFNIGDILEKSPRTCSVGQQQRALLTRALMMDSDVIFADEPEQNLDSDGRIELFESFKEANQTYGKTIVLVTQEHPDILKKYVSRGIKIKTRGIEVYYSSP